MRRAAGRGAAAFPLSEAFGAWRVVGPDGAWQRRPAAAAGRRTSRPTSPRATSPSTRWPSRSRAASCVDPSAGGADLAARRLRAVGPGGLRRRPAAHPARRALRAPSSASRSSPATAAARGAATPAGSRGSPPSGSFAELRARHRLAGAARGAASCHGARSGSRAASCPSSRRCAASSRASTTTATSTTTRSRCSTPRSRSSAIRPRPGCAEHADALRALLAEPLADGLTPRRRRCASRRCCTTSPSPQTRRAAGRRPRRGFPGHDTAGAEVARAILRRLRASERLVDHVAALTLHHLRLGFLVHERPLSRRAIHRYLVDDRARRGRRHRLHRSPTGSPPAGRKADEAIAAPPRARARDARPRARAARRGAAGAARARRRARRARSASRPGPRLGELLAELERGPLRRRGRHAARRRSRRARELLGRLAPRRRPPHERLARRRSRRDGVR